MTHASGNSAQARARVVSTFAPWWKPWRWCRAYWIDYDQPIGADKHRCRLPRRHHGRHASLDGFDVRYFDTATEGTP